MADVVSVGRPLKLKTQNSRLEDTNLKKQPEPVAGAFEFRVSSFEF
jgi:hypothetical protein